MARSEKEQRTPRLVKPETARLAHEPVKLDDRYVAPISTSGIARPFDPGIGGPPLLAAGAAVHY